METTVIPITDAPGKVIIFRPRLGLAFIGNRALAELALKIADGAARSEIPHAVEEFLDKIGFVADDPAEPPAPDAQYRPTTAVLLMTNQCQLRCTYCYAAAGEAPRQELSYELGCSAIDHVCQNALDLGLDRFEVSFHGGGEPTFNWGVLTACADYARQQALPAHLTLTSNGIWSPRQRKWVLENLDGLSLSLDGGPDTQNVQRPFVSGRGSASHVMRTVAELDSHRFPYGIRMTATAPWEQLPRDVAYLVEHTSCQSFQVEPAFNTKRGGHGTVAEEDSLPFIRAYLEAFDIANNAGRRLHYSGARLGLVTTTFCTAPFSALIVNGNADIVTCYEIASSAHTLSRISTIGRITSGAVVVDEAARDQLHLLMAERRSACRDCFCYWSCAGDCYARVFEDRPDGHQQRSTRCHMNRSLTEQLLLRQIASGGGVWQASACTTAPLSAVSREMGI